MEIKNYKISDLKMAEYNPRVITETELAGLKESIKTFGLVENIVVNSDLTVISGHQRIRAMRELGHETVPCFRVDLDKKQEKKLNVLMNSQAISGKYDPVKLEEILLELREDDDYQPLRLDILEPLSMKRSDEVREDDEFDTTPPEEPKTKLGDIYFLNEHRLICGSATDPEIVKKLMWGNEISTFMFDLVVTDPPYNVSYDNQKYGLKSSKIKLDKIQNDSMNQESFYQFLYDFYVNCFNSMKSGAAIYVFHADSEGHNFRKAFLDAGLKMSQCLIWTKQNMILSRQDYRWQHEPILYGWKEGAKHTWYSDRKQTTLLKFDRPIRNGEHPTMKPINILAYLIQNNSKGKDIVGDFFLGSGSTLIACEMTDRVCFGTELDPRYCDVIIRRFINTAKNKNIPFTIKRNGEIIDPKIFDK